MHPLVSAYLDGDLTREEEEALRAWLEADRQHLADFVLCGCMHAQLRELAYQDNVRASATEAAASRSTVQAAAAPGEISQPGPATSQPGKSSPPPAINPINLQQAAWPMTRIVWALSVLLAVGLAAGVYAWLGARPTLVAQLTRTTDCVWTETRHEANQGDLLEMNRELKLLRGTVEITFTSGANVVITGGSHFQLRGTDVGMLYEGQLVAAVPKSAVGFTILTPRATLVDLGTQFSLRVDRDGSLELKVLEGLVELRSKDDAGKELHRLRVAYGRAVHMDARTGTVSTVPFHDPRPASDPQPPGDAESDEAAPKSGK